eukprot:1598392-Heterocapsa_arctica.AAC.1
MDGEDSEEEDVQVLYRQTAENELPAVYSDFVPAYEVTEYDMGDESDVSEHSCDLSVDFDAFNTWRSRTFGDPGRVPAYRG